MQILFFREVPGGLQRVAAIARDGFSEGGRCQSVDSDRYSVAGDGDELQQFGCGGS